jgi:hypothetical protein
MINHNTSGTIRIRNDVIRFGVWRYRKDLEVISPAGQLPSIFIALFVFTGQVTLKHRRGSP